MYTTIHPPRARAGRAMARAGRSLSAAILLAALLAPGKVGAAEPPVIVPALGSFPIVVLLINFPDAPASSKPLSYFYGLIASPDYPSANHWCRENSYGNMNIDGTQIFGWYTVDHPLSYYYFTNAEGNRIFSMDQVIAEVLPQVDPLVDFRPIASIAAMFNCEVASPGFSYGHVWNLDGQQRAYQMIGVGPWGWQRQDVVTHEILHQFGVNHSGGPFYDCGNPDPCFIDSRWDRMGGGTECPDRFAPDPVYGCLGAHTIAWHKHDMGWISPSRAYQLAPSQAGIIAIERLALPPMAAGTYAIAKMPVFGSAEHFYTVEYRNWHGYDGVAAVPGEAVIIHNVRKVLLDRQAQVVTHEGIHDPNGPGGMWLPGQTMTDDSVGAIMHVESIDDAQAIVALSNQPREVVVVDRAWNGFENGVSGTPWNTLAEGYASAHRGGRVVLRAGAYPENLRLTKPCTLERGGTGSAVVGH